MPGILNFFIKSKDKISCTDMFEEFSKLNNWKFRGIDYFLTILKHWSSDPAKNFLISRDFKFFFKSKDQISCTNMFEEFSKLTN